MMPTVLEHLLPNSNKPEPRPLCKKWLGNEKFRTSYRFDIAQIEYLQAKLNTGQTTDRQLDPDVAAKEMWRVPYGTWLFSAAEFLSPQKISSYFSRLATKVYQQQVQVGREDVDADVENKTNIIASLFSRA